MSDVVISVENLSKRYLIGHQFARRESGTTLSDTIGREARNFVRKAKDLVSGRQVVQGDEVEQFWALKDVSFEVKQGEVVGIIGRNGAGKSTLLKILSRITEPTEGRVRIRGRVASLLEVGTGFHGELSGRENIFLNGAILGMKRAEIKRKFDEIIAFAEIEKFLDTPVKRYSSGMYVRLAFSVAAHLEPEIFIIDEVLAVGDAEFQKKCLGKISEVSDQGRTILFVSHNLGAVTRICKKVLLLNAGRVQGNYDNVEQGVSQYLSADQSYRSSAWRYKEDIPLNDYFIPSEVTVDAQLSDVSIDRNLTIRIRGRLLRNDPTLNIVLGIYSSDGTLLFGTTPRDCDPQKWMTLPFGLIELSLQVPTGFLNEGGYYAELAIVLHNRKYLLQHGIGPKVYFSVLPKITHSEFWDTRRSGYLAPLLVWKYHQLLCNSESADTETAASS
jgi:lipopolysaccharide transport system ATP-binding protein